MSNIRRYFATVLIAFCAALAAIWISHRLTDADPSPGGELHALMHEELQLDSAQEAKVDQLESQFAQRRKALDEQLRASNAQLAAAIASEHQYGPRVAEAVDRSHMAMGELQKATLSHVFAMRAVLRPEQAARFEEEIRKALTKPGRR